MYRIDEKADLDKETLTSLIKLSDELERTIARKNLTSYLTPALIVDDYSSLTFSLYNIHPSNLNNISNVNVGVIPVDMIPVEDIEKSNFPSFLENSLTTIENRLYSSQLQRQIVKNTPKISPKKYEHIAKTVAVLSSTVIITTTEDKYGDRTYYTADTAHFHLKTIALAAADLTLDRIMEGLLYEIPENEDNYQEFLDNIATLPSQWLHELYPIDHQISVDEEKEHALYSILSTPPFV